MSSVLNAMSEGTATTWNGAISNPTTGFGKGGALLDYFAKCGTYRGRTQEAVNASMAGIFSDNEEQALKLLFGLRLITRKPNEPEFDDVQTGFGARDEFYKGIVWLHNNKPDLLYRNLHLIPVFGCWKDFVNEPLIDVLDKPKVFELFKNNVDNDLLRKYLPQIRSKSNLRTERDKKRVKWAQDLCRFVSIDGKMYRKWKSVGQAHIWQKQMMAKDWDNINFNGIPGKAMLLHTSQKGKDKKTVFERHNQVERLMEWVKSKPSVKFTGYPYELTSAASIKKNPSLVQQFIYNKQFETLIEPMKAHKLGNVLACLDTSGSMTMTVAGKATAYDICISMGVVFSSLNVGYFKDAVVAFDDTSKLIKLNGEFCNRLHQIERMETAWGSTNFQSVIDLLVETRRKNPQIPIEEYPETLLVVSDMQFSPVGGNTETNYKAAMKKLAEVGLGSVRIIWWFVNGAGTDFPSQMDDKGVYMIGGFDPVNIKALMGLNATKKDFVAKEKVEETPTDGMNNFLNQPIFSLIK